MRGLAGVVLSMVLLAGALTTANAQALRGTVLLPDSTPAVGVIIVATDARGDATRALTGARGEFQLRLPTAGRYAVSMLRIGFRPTDGPRLDLAAGATEVLQLVFAAQPVRLSTVNVRDRETCRVNADTGLMVARAWGEARKAMLSTQLTTNEAPLFAEWIEYERTLDSAVRIVRDQRVRTQRHPTTHAFRSQPAEVLSARGYVVADSSGTSFYAPDADVLLSDTFASTHCFALKAPPAGQGELLGIGFEPTRNRGDMRDIEGTLWLDRESAELRILEFRYTNMPDAASTARAGGEVEFLRLDDGNWLVSRWNVRMPQLVLERLSNLRLKRLEVSGARAVLRGIHVSGGELTRVLRRDSVAYALAGSEVVLQVMQRDTVVRASEATLVLEGTDYTTTASASGLLQLWPVLAGSYRAHIRTPAMDALGMPPIVMDVQARNDGRVDTLTLPEARTLVQLTVTDAQGNALSGVTLDASGAAVQARSLTTGADGRVSLPNAAPGTIEITARKLGYQAGRVSYEVEPGQNSVPIILSQLSAPMLDTMRVVGRAPTVARLQGFETRRINRMATVSMTSEEIHQRNPVHLWQMLTSVAAVRVVDMDTIVLAASARAGLTSLLHNDACYYRIAIDGVVVNFPPSQKGADLRMLPPPQDIHGIEVFAGPAAIPPQFASSGTGGWCGLIAIWTK